MVVTPDMVPPNPSPYDEEASFFKTLAADAEQTQQQWNASNRAREEAAKSPGFDAGHQTNNQTAADFGRLAGVYHEAATYFSSVAEVYRTAHRGQQSAINNANNELAHAKTPVEQQAIVARWHTHARSLTNSAIAEAEQKSRSFTQTLATTSPRSTQGPKALRRRPQHCPIAAEKASPYRPEKRVQVYRMSPHPMTAHLRLPTTARPVSGTSTKDGLGKGGRGGVTHQESDDDAPSVVPPVTNPFPSGGGQMPSGGSSPLQSLGGFASPLSSAGGGLNPLSSGGGLGGLGSGGGLPGLGSVVCLVPRRPGLGGCQVVLRRPGRFRRPQRRRGRSRRACRRGRMRGRR